MKIKTPVIQKKAAGFYDKVGIEIKRCLAKNKIANQPPRDQQELAKNLQISPYQLSRYINGQTLMPAKIVTRLCDGMGFPNRHFMAFYTFQKQEIIPEILTKDDMLRLVFEYQILVKEQERLYSFAWDKLESFTRQNKELVNANVALMKDIDKLHDKIKELKRELKYAEDKNSD